MTGWFLIGLRFGFAALLAIVTWLSIAPNPDESHTGMAATRMIADFFLGDAAHADKVGHFAAYGALGASVFFARILHRPFWAAPLALGVYGVALEGVQYFLDARAAESLDALANAAGALTGVTGAAIVVALAARLSGAKTKSGAPR